MLKMKKHSLFTVKFTGLVNSLLASLIIKPSSDFFLVWLTTSAYFENFIILLISLNSIFLGIKDYTDVKNESARNDFVETSDIYFIVIFTFECISKVCA